VRNPKDDPRYDTKGAAAHIGCSPRTLEKRRQVGGGPVFLKIGRSVVYLQSDLDRWLMACRRVSTSDCGSEAISAAYEGMHSHQDTSSNA